MKLYKVEYGFSQKGKELIGIEWVGTQLDAKKRKQELMDGVAYDIDITAVEIPTDKVGLLTFLNTELKGDL